MKFGFWFESKNENYENTFLVLHVFQGHLVPSFQISYPGGYIPKTRISSCIMSHKVMTIQLWHKILFTLFYSLYQQFVSGGNERNVYCRKQIYNFSILSYISWNHKDMFQFPVNKDIVMSKNFFLGTWIRVLFKDCFSTGVCMYAVGIYKNMKLQFYHTVI